MANETKECNDCGKLLPATKEHFHKCTSRPDGFQIRCKPCQNQRTEEYRKGKGKNYWFDENGRDGWFREPHNKIKFANYLKENYYAKFNCKVYAITNPEGMVYIGHTRYPTVSMRMSRHKNDYNSSLRNNKRNKIPLLYDSFTKFGFNNHTAILIEELDTNDSEIGLKREAEYIQQFINKGISLNKKL